jgi:hypothetical protein
MTMTTTTVAQDTAGDAVNEGRTTVTLVIPEVVPYCDTDFLLKLYRFSFRIRKYSP